MEKIKRAIHYDFHTLPHIDDIASKWDAEKFAKTLKKANVEIINATAQCNIGHAYFPTKIGVMYPGLKIDLFGELVRACKKEGIKVVGYVSTGLNHEACNRHPEWSRVNGEGQVIYGDRTGNFFRTQCFNTGYTEHILGILQEVLDYDVDGLFLDNVISRHCYCPTCTKLMKEQGINMDNPDDVYAFAYSSTREFAKKIRAMVPMDKYLYTNGFGETFSRTHGEVECLPCGGWGYDNFSSVVSLVRNLYDQTVYMTGRFQRSWGDFGGYRTRASLENDFYDALLHNSQISVGDHLDPKGELDEELYDMIGDIYGRLMKYEKWTDSAKYIKEVGIIRNISDAYTPYEDRFIWDGAARVFAELKYNFDVINENMDFTPYKVLILPDIVHMTPKLKEKLEKYLEDPTKAVLSSGKSLLDRKNNHVEGKCWDFVDFCGMDEKKTAYFKPNGEKRTIAMYDTGVLMKTDKENVLATYVEPYFDKHWDGLHGYFYTPPKGETEYAAVAEKNNWRHISFKVFNAYYNHAYKYHRDLIEDFMNKYVKEPFIDECDMPSTSRITLTGTDEYKLLHVKVTYPEVRGMTDIIEEHNVLPAGRKVKVLGEYKKVTILPSEKEVTFTFDGKYTEITLPEITGYEMFRLDM